MKSKILNLTKGLMVTFLWSFSILMFAQNITVEGTVTDNNGEALIGVTVQVQGTTIGTITDMEGNYTLPNVPPNGTLIVSYIGMQSQTVAVAGRNNINITLMEDLQALEEVIVIGYGTAKRKDFTGSVSSVKLEDSPVALMSNMNALESIKGNVPGLDIGVTNSAGG